MNDELHTWLNERETIHGKATEGPWESHETTAATAWSGAADWSGPIDDREPVADGAPEDVAAIVDAHNTLPKLTAALKAVLELHRPYEWSFGYGPVYSCVECSRPGGNLGKEEEAEWPCLTVQKLQEAISDEE